MPPRPPKKAQPDFAKLNVSRGQIDDPTSAFPIGSLNDVDSVEGDAVQPLSPESAKPRSSPPSESPAAPSGWVVAGIDLRWLVLSLLAGGVLAVCVVAMFGLVVLLVR